MVSTVFALIAAAQMLLLALTIRLRARQPGWVPTLLILVIVALIWDNAVIAAGRPLGAGELLRALSVPRFVTHALLVPLLIMVGAGLGRRFGVDWLRGRVPPAIFGGLTLLLIVLGLYREVLTLDLAPETYADTIRYTNAASPGPPIPAIVTILVLIAIGIALLVRSRWPWLLAGSVTMFAAAGAGAAVPWLGNLGELILTATLWQTATRIPATADRGPPPARATQELGAARSE